MFTSLKTEGQRKQLRSLVNLISGTNVILEELMPAKVRHVAKTTRAKQGAGFMHQVFGIDMFLELVGCDSAVILQLRNGMKWTFTGLEAMSMRCSMFRCGCSLRCAF